MSHLDPQENCFNHQLALVKTNRVNLKLVKFYKLFYICNCHYITSIILYKINPLNTYIKLCQKWPQFIMFNATLLFSRSDTV